MILLAALMPRQSTAAAATSASARAAAVARPATVSLAATRGAPAVATFFAPMLGLRSDAPKAGRAIAALPEPLRGDLRAMIASTPHDRSGWTREGGGGRWYASLVVQGYDAAAIELFRIFYGRPDAELSIAELPSAEPGTIGYDLRAMLASTKHDRAGWTRAEGGGGKWYAVLVARGYAAAARELFDLYYNYNGSTP